MLCSAVLWFVVLRRWRCYRYVPGAVYRPHVDGAWPGSTIDATGVAANLPPPPPCHRPGSGQRTQLVQLTPSPPLPPARQYVRVRAPTYTLRIHSTYAETAFVLYPTVPYVSSPYTGEYHYDGFKDGRMSRLTFLVYLNDDFTGGCKCSVIGRRYYFAALCLIINAMPSFALTQVPRSSCRSPELRELYRAGECALAQVRPRLQSFFRVFFVTRCAVWARV